MLKHRRTSLAKLLRAFGSALRGKELETKRMPVQPLSAFGANNPVAAGQMGKEPADAQRNTCHDDKRNERSCKMMITQCKRAGVVGYEGQHERMGQISSEGIASDPVQHTAKRLGSRIFCK